MDDPKVIIRDLRRCAHAEYRAAILQRFGGGER
jgi:hypothetical protein